MSRGIRAGGGGGVAVGAAVFAAVALVHPFLPPPSSPSLCMPAATRSPPQATGNHANTKSQHPDSTPLPTNWTCVILPRGSV